jgi:ankyrin repeat protein
MKRVLIVLIMSLFLQGCHQAFSDYSQFYQAIIIDDVQHVSRLLANGENPNQTLKNGTTPLMIAASSDSVRSIKLLIKYGAKVNQANEDGVTAYLAAAASGNSGDAKRLVQQGADACARNKEGQDGYAIALAWGNHIAAKHLLALQKKCSFKRGSSS